MLVQRRNDVQAGVFVRLLALRACHLMVARCCLAPPSVFPIKAGRMQEGMKPLISVFFPGWHNFPRTLPVYFQLHLIS